MNRKKLRISIVIPAYNEEHYLKKCLEALANQTELADEIIVVDNNSTDRTAQIAKEYPKVILIYEYRQGLYYSRGTGMSIATGDILCRIDADTIVSPDWVAVIKRAFNDPTINAITGPFEYHDMPLQKVGGYVDDKIRKLLTKTGYPFLSGANMAIRSTAWERIKGSLCNNGQLFEDIDIALHLDEVNMSPVYEPLMYAAMSSRRFENMPRDFFRYAGGHSRTLEYHGKHHYGAFLAEAILGGAYVGIKPFHKAYNPDSKRISLEYWRAEHTARPDPMRTGNS